MPENDERLNDIAETSKRLAVSTFTTRRLIKSGQLRAVRIARRVLIPEREILRAMREGCGKHANRPD
jgi:excisionase family DNA binding protein